MDSITAAVQSGDNYRLKSAIESLSASERSELVKTEAGKQVVFSAASHDGQLLQTLIESGFEASYVNTTGETPLHIAVKRNQLAHVEVLLKSSSCDPNAADGHRQTAIHRAGEYGHDECLKALIACDKVDINAEDAWSRTALHWTCVKGLVDRTRELLDRGARVIVTVTKESPVHWAVRCEKPNLRNDTLKLLFEKRPEVTVYEYNDRSETAMDMAKVSGTEETIELLKQHAEATGQSPPSENVVVNETHVHESGVRMNMKPKGGVRKLTIKRGNE